MAGQTVILCGQSQRDFACNLILCAPKDAVVNIRKARRTGEQNAKMWAMLSDISRAQPQGRKHTADQWKDIMMKACGHEVQFVVGLDDEAFPIGLRSSALNKEQMADLITFMQAYGDMHGVQWTEAA